MIVTVKDLIKELLEFNPEAKVFVGDNIDNHITLSWGGADGCEKHNCDDVGIQNENSINVETVQFEEPSYRTIPGGMNYVNTKIVITDPCYMKFSKPDMKRSTIYGDWSCMVYPGKLGENKDPELWEYTYFSYLNRCNNKELDEEEKNRMRKEFVEFRENWLKEHTLGEFTADAGEVGVFRWAQLTEKERRWIEEHPYCAAVIEHATGDVSFKLAANENKGIELHVVCEGRTPFFTTQSGL